VTSTGNGVYFGALLRFLAVPHRHAETIRASRRVPTRPDVTAPYLKPYKLLPFEPQAIDDFDKYVALFRDSFKPEVADRVERQRLLA
jgi:hypothetical protein